MSHGIELSFVFFLCQSAELRLSFSSHNKSSFSSCLSPLQIKEACQELILDDKSMKEIMKRFLHEIQLGLKKETHPKADIKCFVTYVQDLPNGKGE
jgi:hexokinase